MCFVSPTPPEKKKGCSKNKSKAGPEGPRIILSPHGARFSFSSTSKLPSNLFIRQDFYGTDKIHLSHLPPLRLGGTISAHIQGQYAAQPSTDAVVSQFCAEQYAIPPAPLQPPTTTPSAVLSTGAELISAISAAQLLAHGLHEACAAPHFSHLSHSSCSSCPPVSSCNQKKPIRGREQRDSLILSLERQIADEIAAMKLDREIERKVASAIRDKEVQALINGTKDGGLGIDGCLWGRAHEQSTLNRAESELDRRESRLLLREREQERRLLSFDTGSGNGRGISTSDAQLQFNLFQDLHTGRGDGNARSEAHASYMDGLRDGWERRRSSVVSTLDRGARRLMDTVARVEAEVESMRRRNRREDERECDRWDRWDRRGSDGRGLGERPLRRGVRF